MNNSNLHHNKENVKKAFKPNEAPNKGLLLDENRQVLKNVGNTHYAEDFLSFMKKRTFKENPVSKLKVDESLDESLIQVVNQKKDSEGNKCYNQVILKNETGLRFDDDSVKQYILNPENSLTCSKPLKELEKADQLVKNNPQYVVDYIDDIFNCLKENEEVNTSSKNYMKSQYDINPKMRSILVDWLVEVHLKFKLVPETLYLTINLMDRYLSVSQIERRQFQLLGATCMLIASKYEEIYAPEIRDFVYITDKAYSKEDIKMMEEKVLIKLNYELLTVSPYRFLERLVFLTGNDQTLFFLSQYILELTLLEYSMYRYSPLTKACSAVFLGRKILKLQPNWPKVLEKATDKTEVLMRSCVRDLCGMIDCSLQLTLKGVRNKFSLPKFLEVSKLLTKIMEGQKKLN